MTDPMSTEYPHLRPGEWSRGRVVRELQEAGWWTVAEDVAGGIGLDAVLERLIEIGEGTSSAADILAQAIPSLEN